MMVGLKPSHGQSDSTPKITDDSGGMGRAERSSAVCARRGGRLVLCARAHRDLRRWFPELTARNETRLSGETEFHPPLIPPERCFSLSVTRDRGCWGVADPVIAEAATLQMKD